MSRTITRIYDSYQQALAAGRELINLGFTGEQVTLLVHRESHEGGVGSTREEGAHGENTDAIAQELSRMGVGEEEARTYAARVEQGEVLLSVRAPDLAEEAIRIMDRHDPARTTERKPMRTMVEETDQKPVRSMVDEHEKSDHSDPAPLSRLLHMPVLSDDPAPLSHLLHIPVLAED